MPGPKRRPPTARLTSPHAYYLLGLIARAQDRPDDAVRAFQKALELDPADVGTKVNLGQVYTQQRQYAQAITLLREAIATEPYNATAAYGLAMALTRSGDQGGPAAMQRFETLRGTPYARTYSQTYLEQGQYAEALASTGAEADLVDPAPPAVTFADVTADALRGSSAAVSAPGGSVVLVDIDNDGDLDILESGSDGLHLFRNTSGSFADASAAAGFGALGARTGVGCGRRRLRQRRPRRHLRGYRRRTPAAPQRENGTFEAAPGSRTSPVSASGRCLPPSSTSITTATSISYIAGEVAAERRARRRARSNQLLRNNGNGTFTDITSDAKVARRTPAAFAIVPTDFDNRRDIDLLLVRSQGRAAALPERARRHVPRGGEPTPACPEPADVQRGRRRRYQQGRLYRFLLRPRPTRRASSR